MKIALITGMTSQDDVYLVHGLKRRTSLFNADRIDHFYQDPHERWAHEASLIDGIRVAYADYTERHLV